MIRGDRIRELIALRNTTQAALAGAIGVTPQAVSKMATSSTTDSSKLHQIARFLRTTPEYLTGETDDPSLPYGIAVTVAAVPADTEVHDLDGMVMINEVEIALGLGGAYLDGPPVVRQIPFPENWLRLFTDAPAELLEFVEGRGDSMGETVPDRSICLIDRSRTRLDEQDALWAVVYGGLGMIKRLRQMPDGTVKIISDNPSVPPETATDGELFIFGRCRGVFKRT